MPIVKAYQCPHTGQFWPLDQKTEYKKHLKCLSNERATDRRIRKERREHDAWFKHSIEELTTIGEIEQWAAENFVRFWRRTDRWGDRLDRNFKITRVHLSIFKLEISNCSNTHSSPRGKKTNWGGKVLEDDGVTPVPRGYPGLTGDINIEFEGRSPSATSDAFSAMGLNTGSGGSRSFGLGYGLTMFAEDWPGLRKAIEGEQIIKRLKGNG